MRFAKATLFSLGLIFSGLAYAQSTAGTAGSDVKYEGKSVREWAGVFREGDQGRERASAAFRAIGSPAVPMLIELMDAKEQPLTRAGAATALWQLSDRAEARAILRYSGLAK